MAEQLDRFRSFTERYVIARATHFPTGREQQSAWEAIQDAKKIYGMVAEAENRTDPKDDMNVASQPPQQFYSAAGGGGGGGAGVAVHIGAVGGGGGGGRAGGSGTAGGGANGAMPTQPSSNTARNAARALPFAPPPSKGMTKTWMAWATTRKLARKDKRT